MLPSVANRQVSRKLVSFFGNNVASWPVHSLQALFRASKNKLMKHWMKHMKLRASFAFSRKRELESRDLSDSCVHCSVSELKVLINFDKKNGTKVKTGNRAGNRQIASDWISASQKVDLLKLPRWFPKISQFQRGLDSGTVEAKLVPKSKRDWTLAKVLAGPGISQMLKQRRSKDKSSPDVSKMPRTTA